jgi:hypothetical protein
MHRIAEWRWRRTKLLMSFRFSNIFFAPPILSVAQFRVVGSVARPLSWGMQTSFFTRPLVIQVETPHELFGRS